jgi:hypothetical protein
MVQAQVGVDVRVGDSPGLVNVQPVRPERWERGAYWVTPTGDVECKQRLTEAHARIVNSFDYVDKRQLTVELDPNDPSKLQLIATNMDFDAWYGALGIDRANDPTCSKLRIALQDRSGFSRRSFSP